MSGLEADTIGGFNAMIEKQNRSEYLRQIRQKCSLTMCFAKAILSLKKKTETVKKIQHKKRRGNASGN